METLLDKEDSVFNPPQLGCVLSLTGLPGGDSKIYDRSPYGNIGAITGATWQRLPSGLWYLDFDGMDDHVDFGVGALPVLSSDFTYKLWFKDDEGSGGQGSILSGNVTNSIDINRYTDDKLRVTKVDVAHILSTGAVVPLGSWVHAVITRDDATDTWSIYINGSLENSTVDTREIVAAGVRYIGSGQYTPFMGGIALVEVSYIPWDAITVANSFNREKHLFGVW